MRHEADPLASCAAVDLCRARVAWTRPGHRPDTLDPVAYAVYAVWACDAESAGRRAMMLYAGVYGHQDN